jgi:hypothetical protein
MHASIAMIAELEGCQAIWLGDFDVVAAYILNRAIMTMTRDSV